MRSHGVEEGAPERDSARDETIRMASNHVKDGAYADAEKLLVSLLLEVPSDQTARYLLGMARYRAKDHQGAERAFRALVELTPDHAQGQYGLAVALIDQGRRDEAIPPLESALRARPDFPEAQDRLSEIRAGAAPPPGSHWTSLAEALDTRSGVPLDDAAMAGVIRWTGRPVALSLTPAALLAAVVLLVPVALIEAVEATPGGWPREGLAQVWRLLSAASIPLALVVLATAGARWFTTVYTVRDRRLEVSRGILRRRHMVLWFHDIERQPIVEQTLVDLVLGMGSVVLITDALLESSASRRQRLGRIVLKGLTAQHASRLAELIRQATMMERRRMIANFMSTR